MVQLNIKEIRGADNVLEFFGHVDNEAEGYSVRTFPCHPLRIPYWLLAHRALGLVDGRK